MKKLLCCVLITLSCNSCWLFTTKPLPPSTNPPTTWLSCLDAKVHNEALTVLEKVTTDLVTVNFDKALLDLIATLPADIAWSAVACAVQLATDQAHTASMASPNDALAIARETNGRAWLAKYNVAAQK